ncbi:MAG: c-type cytochrome [Chloroflexota bacterium]
MTPAPTRWGLFLRVSIPAIIGLILILQTQDTTTAAPPRQGPPSPLSLERGAALWPTNCAPCHGPMGQGDGPTAASLEHPPTNFTDVALAQERTLADMFDITANGRIERLMPPWKNRLSEQDMWDVVAYAQSLSVTPETIEQGTVIYAESCAACHGENGISSDLDLTNPGLLVEANDQDLFETLRSGNDPHDSLIGLSDEALWQSVAFVRTLSLDKPVLDGQITGFLRNGTTGEMLPNTPVNLYALSSAGEVVQTYSGQSDTSGRYTFSSLNANHTVSYALEGFHQSISYISPDPIFFLPDSKEVVQDLVLFDVTDSDEMIVQQRLHRIVVFDPNQVRLADVHVFVNEGNQTYIGRAAEDGQLATLKVALPENAFSVQFQDETIRGFGDHYLSQRTVIPGQETFVSVQYNLPYDGGSEFRLETPLFYEVESINVLAADVGQTIDSTLVEFQGTEEFQGNTYQLLRGANPSANEPWIMDITNIDVPEPIVPANSPENAVVPQTVGQDQTLLLYTLLGIGAATLIFSLFYSRTTPKSSTNVTRLASEKRRLFILLAELERQYQAGEIDSPRYHQLRAQNRAKLKQMLAQEKGLSV